MVCCTLHGLAGSGAECDKSAGFLHVCTEWSGPGRSGNGGTHAGHDGAVEDAALVARGALHAGAASAEAEIAACDAGGEAGYVGEVPFEGRGRGEDEGEHEEVCAGRREGRCG